MQTEEISELTSSVLYMLNSLFYLKSRFIFYKPIGIQLRYIRGNAVLIIFFMIKMFR